MFPNVALTSPPMVCDVHMVTFSVVYPKSPACSVIVNRRQSTGILLQTCATSTYERDDGEETHDKDQRVLVLACEGKVKSPSMTFEQPAHQSHAQRTFSPRPAVTHETGINTNNTFTQLLLAKLTKLSLNPGLFLIFFSGVNNPVVIRLTKLADLPGRLALDPCREMG